MNYFTELPTLDNFWHIAGSRFALQVDSSLKRGLHIPQKLVSLVYRGRVLVASKLGGAKQVEGVARTRRDLDQLLACLQTSVVQRLKLL